MKFFIALFALVAVAVAAPGYEHAHHVDAIQVPQQPAIPPLHPHPLHLKAHAHVQHIPYHHAHIGHPHLIGYEVAVHEPEVKHVVKPVHGHGW
ncbi:histidine-rich glycoprotein isoform X2 [Fopius arisanus]|uniref:Histidine-rich glycoprotein isoform X2 n=1 Tax=Fopius arisanus TaxID=64838 RepID=A0A9R1TJQ5_9HYME|nr:PREDICTED: histidine-rich glycoprotein isoform X2 [Fopius arisanus]